MIYFSFKNVIVHIYLNTFTVALIAEKHEYPSDLVHVIQLLIPPTPL